MHHGYLGIGINSVTPTSPSTCRPAAKRRRCFDIRISEVTPDSPASNGGLKSGDVLRELNGKKIDNASTFQVAVSEMAPGTSLNLGVLRDEAGKPFT